LRERGDVLHLLAMFFGGRLNTERGKGAHEQVSRADLFGDCLRFLLLYIDARVIDGFGIAGEGVTASSEQTGPEHDDYSF